MNRGGSWGSTRGGGRGGRGKFQQRDIGSPDNVFEMGSFIHAVEDEMLCSSLMIDKVPYFNAPIYLQNKSVIGKVDEILGPMNEVFFSVKMGEGMVANSFKKGDKVYIAADKLLPIERFLPKPKITGSVAKRGSGTRGGAGGRGRVIHSSRGGGRGGFGGNRRARGSGRGGFGGGRAAQRGVFSSRGGWGGRGLGGFRG